MSVYCLFASRIMQILLVGSSFKNRRWVLVQLESHETLRVIRITVWPEKNNPDFPFTYSYMP